MVKKKAYLSLEKEEGEGYLQYPSPHFGLGFPQSFKRYFIDTTVLRFDQGSFSTGEGVSVASTGTMPPMWTQQVVGARLCFSVF